MALSSTSLNNKINKTLGNENSKNKSNKKNSNKITNERYNTENLNVFGEKNHALNFGQYTNRKNMINLSQNEKNVLTYLEPYDYLSSVEKCPNFKKMTKRKPLIIDNKGIPSIGHYHPNYKFVEKTSHAVYFDKKPIESGKKALMHHIWSSYDCSGNYISVDFDKKEDLIKAQLEEKKKHKNDKIYPGYDEIMNMMEKSGRYKEEVEDEGKIPKEIPKFSTD
ncbi:MAG: hypothetical protein MJ252_10170 [archaeon]|nr:hypothetical protein [archaeon]